MASKDEPSFHEESSQSGNRERGRPHTSLVMARTGEAMHGLGESLGELKEKVAGCHGRKKERRPTCG